MSVSGIGVIQELNVSIVSSGKGAEPLLDTGSFKRQLFGPLTRVVDKRFLVEEKVSTFVTLCDQVQFSILGTLLDAVDIEVLLIQSVAVLDEHLSASTTGDLSNHFLVPSFRTVRLVRTRRIILVGWKRHSWQRLDPGCDSLLRFYQCLQVCRLRQLRCKCLHTWRHGSIGITGHSCHQLHWPDWYFTFVSTSLPSHHFGISHSGQQHFQWVW